MWRFIGEFDGLIGCDFIVIIFKFREHSISVCGLYAREVILKMFIAKL
jgi:hypothetical protein